MSVWRCVPGVGRFARGARSGRTRAGAVGRRPRAFSLIEMLMVLAIVAVMTAITLPQLTRSMRGNRLRAACREVIMMGRYARSMALLDQQERSVVLDLDAGTLAVRAANVVSTNRGDSAEEWGAQEGGGAAAQPEPAAATVQVGGADEVRRTLDRVRIESVELGGGTELKMKGLVSILYRTNGRCDPYTVTLMDESGEDVVVDVDALSAARTREKN